MTQSDEGRSAVTGPTSRYDPIQFAIMELNGKIGTLTQILEIRENTQNLELKHLREAMNQQHQDHEARLRLLEQRPLLSDMETRMRVMEQRPYVAPKTVWTALALLLTFGGLVIATINLATR